MTSFTRKVKSSVSNAGTRPGPLGQTLISSGNSDLDRILGGGIPLGCVLLLLEDGRTHHHLTFLQCFVAEGLNNQQAVLWAASQRAFSAAKLPAINQSHGSVKGTERQAAASGGQAGDLRIAWQYRQYLGNQQSTPPAGRDETVAPARQGDAILQSFLQIQRAVKGRPITAMVTLPAGVMSASVVMRLQHMSDAVLALEAVQDDSPAVRLLSDPESCVGLLHVRRLPCLNTIWRRPPDIQTYTLRHRRRRLAIEPFQVDPDAEAQAASSASGGQSSASGLLCGGPPMAASPLDF
ncbi:hypothetical protein WJX73_008158 [Symbiochloris irregularis]|uniref:Elongator complex protein 4 n=1 Tax=Symbiochloris irregularis TaxID=706552 RepID=A0AAW1NNQ9_9CHLO